MRQFTDTIGFSSKAGNKHILMMDLDFMTRQRAVSVAETIIKRYRTSDIYLVSSSPGHYHLFCLDKFPFKEVLGIVKQYCNDVNYYKIRSRYKELILRATLKGQYMPKFYKAIVSPHRRRKRSNAHRILLSRIYGLNMEWNHSFDNNTKIHLDYYRTIRRGKNGQHN